MKGKEVLDYFSGFRIYCNKNREKEFDDKNYWELIEIFVTAMSDVIFDKSPNDLVGIIPVQKPKPKPKTNTVRKTRRRR